GVTVTQIEASNGYYHACAILNGSVMKCWGYNSQGQLGQDTNGAQYYIPTIAPINLGTGRHATEISLGYRHTCAVLDDGSVKCWGENDYGQLGKGDTAIRGKTTGDMAALTPVDLGTGVLGAEVCSGRYHNCVRTTTGK